MEQIIYENVILASLVVMYAYGLFSLLTLSPEGREYDNYRISRRVFGITMVMWASYLVVHWCFNLRLHNPLLASTLCLSCYFPGIMLFEVTFSSLIDRNYQVVRRIKRIICNALVINVIVFANYLFFELAVQKIVLSVMAMGFTIEMIVLSRRFLITYRDALRRADNYYSDNIDIFIRWMPNSIYIAIVFGFAGSVLSFASNSAVSVYMFGGLLLFTYIFISYQNYMINITKMKDLLLSDDGNHESKENVVVFDSRNSEVVVDNSEVVDKSAAKVDLNRENREVKKIEKELKMWISKKGYVKKSLTIEELAVKLGTNRTYLSLFINSTYNLSFREWVAKQRIEYAKELLLTDEEMLSNKIADKIGYSPNAFTTIFTKSVKMSPMQWRSANKQLKNSCK